MGREDKSTNLYIKIDRQLKLDFDVCVTRQELSMTKVVVALIKMYMLSSDDQKKKLMETYS